MDLLKSWQKKFRIKLLIEDLCSNHKQRVRLYKLLESYCGSMGSLIEVFNKLYSRRKEDNDKEYLFFEHVLLEVELKNISIVEALKHVLPPDEVMLIEATSIKGNAAEGFKRARLIAEKRGDARASVRMALAYPIYVLTTVILLFYFILESVVPQLLDLLPIEKWPSGTHFLYALYIVIVKHKWLSLGLLIGTTVIIKYSLSLKRGTARKILDVLPPWSIQKRLQSSIFLIALGDLIKNGYSFPRAIQSLKQSAQPYLKSHLYEIESRLQSNQPVGQAMDVGLFVNPLMGYLKDFSLVKNFSHHISELGEQAIQETVNFTKILAVTLGILGVILAASANGYVAVSINLVQKTYANELRQGSR